MPSARALEAAAWLAAIVFFVAALTASHGLALQTPDSTQYAITARSLTRGDGFTIDFVRFHVGFHDTVRHVPTTHALLPPLLLAALFSLFGAHLGLVAIPGLLAVSATGLLTFHLGRRVFGPTVGLAGCVLVLTSPAFFLGAVTGNDDVLLACAYLASILCLLDALHGGSSRAWALAGVFGGLALLVKMEGVLWMAVAGSAWLLAARAGQPRGGRRALWLFAPFAACLGLYVARGLLTSGSPFPPSLEWLLKVTPARRWAEVSHAIVPSPPGPVEILQQVGGARLLHLALAPLGAFLHELVRWGPLRQGVVPSLVYPGFLGAVGLVGLLVQLRGRREFATLGIVSLLACAVLLAGLHHVESRYLLLLAPLLLVAALGLAEQALGLLAKVVPRPVVRGVAIAGLGALGLANAPFVPWLAGFARAPRPAAGDACYEAIRAAVPEDDAILAFGPEAVTWYTERPAVAFPSGGVPAVRRVARHYHTPWLLARPGVPARPASQGVADELSRHPDAEVVHRSDRCLLVRLPPRLFRRAVAPQRELQTGTPPESG